MQSPGNFRMLASKIIRQPWLYPSFVRSEWSRVCHPGCETCRPLHCLVHHDLVPAGVQHRASWLTELACTRGLLVSSRGASAPYCLPCIHHVVFGAEHSDPTRNAAQVSSPLVFFFLYCCVHQPAACNAPRRGCSPRLRGLHGGKSTSPYAEDLTTCVGALSVTVSPNSARLPTRRAVP